MNHEEEKTLVTLADIRKMLRADAWIEIGGATLTAIVTGGLVGLWAWACQMGKNPANPFMMKLFLAFVLLPAILVGAVSALNIAHAVRACRVAYGNGYRIALDKLYRVSEDEPLGLSFFERFSARTSNYRNRAEYFVKAFYFDTYGRAIVGRSHVFGIGIEGNPYYLVLTNKGDRILCAFDATTHRLEGMENNPENDRFRQ